MLTDTACKALQPKDKVYRKADSKGMCLEIHPNGGKYWRWKYRFLGSAKLLSLGVYPQTSLKEARAKADELRLILARGEDPAMVRKKLKQENIEETKNTFKLIALEYLEKKKKVISERTCLYMLRRFKANVFPFIGDVQIKKITRKDILHIIQQVQDRGCNDTARKIKQEIGQVFLYAVNTARSEHNIVADVNMLQISKTEHHPYFGEKEFVEFLKKLDGWKINLTTRHAWWLLNLHICEEWRAKRS